MSKEPKSVVDIAIGELRKIERKYQAQMWAITDEMIRRGKLLDDTADAVVDFMNELIEQHSLNMTEVETVDEDDRLDEVYLRPPESMTKGEPPHVIGLIVRLMGKLGSVAGDEIARQLRQLMQDYNDAKDAIRADIQVEDKGRMVSYRVIDDRRYRDLRQWQLTWRDHLRLQANRDPIIVPPDFTVRFNVFSPETPDPTLIPLSQAKPIPPGAAPRGSKVPGSLLLRDYCHSCAEPVRVSAIKFDPDKRPTCQECGGTNADETSDRVVDPSETPHIASRQDTRESNDDRGSTLVEIGVGHREKLRALIESLNGAQHKLLMDHFVHGKSQAQIAAEEGVTTRAVEKGVGRIRKLFIGMGLPKPRPASAPPRERAG